MQNDTRMLNPGVRFREVLAWAMLDFANSGYTTVVLTAVFSAYFVSVVAAKAAWATLAWTATLSLSYLLVMFSLPVIATYADAHAGKRRLLFGSMTGCVLFTFLLAAVGPGDWWLAIVAIVCSNYFFSLSESAIASFLPLLARPTSLGRISGWAWGLGYAGGLFALGIALWLVTRGEQQGLGAQVTVPQVMLATGVIFALAAVPGWFLLQERAVVTSSPTEMQNSVFRTRGLFFALRETFVGLGRDFPEFRRLLFCIVCYQAGIAVVITLAAVYAEQVMGFSLSDTITLIVAVNIAAAVGAFLFGSLQDRIGHRRALTLALFGWLVTALTAFAAVRVEVFWVAACLAGICMGVTQSAGRAMVGALAPSDRLSRFFALWSFSTQLAAAIGPLSYGLVVWLTQGNQRLAMLSTSLFFIFALFILRTISWEKGQQQKCAANKSFCSPKQLNGFS